MVTHTHSQPKIEAGLSRSKITNARFVYYDLPEWFSRVTFSQPGEHLYVYAWEIGVFFFLRSRYRKNEFDRAHRITISSYRYPSFAWYFARHFTVGPLASGERFALQFLSIYSFRGKMQELFRLVTRRLSLIDPLVLLTFYKADSIITITEDTRNILPAFARRKATVTDYFISVESSAFDAFAPAAPRSSNKLRLLYIGRVVEWKGVMLVLQALKNLDGRLEYEFTLMGNGPGKSFYEAYARKHRLSVDFVSPVGIPRRSLSAYYLSHDLFVFPGLHGTGSYVMLEANLHGLPVLTLDVSIPNCFSDYHFDWVIDTRDK
ncbi:MAG: glycosyltransferase family 4 protein, partial [Ferruginibacter sp.]|nr:glycosyltransferase family 4 protein [Cytophagales bacterium]